MSVNHDDDHRKALNETGFWGKAGAGCIPFSIITRKFLFVYRSKSVEQPHTWGNIGGAIDGNSGSPKSHAIRELREETRYSGVINKMIPLITFKSKTFVYYNFIAVIDNEYIPYLNWENEDSKWVEFEDWPRPLHFGIEFILNDSQSVTTMRRLANRGS